jgi:hypothetical protein
MQVGKRGKYYESSYADMLLPETKLYLDKEKFEKNKIFFSS